ncbi:MAG: hypothetical protein GQ540_07395 [Lutibacter sp.]|nr:hypothetical protein [Lutibacter sp.]
MKQKMKSSIVLIVLLLIGVNVNAQWKKNKANEDSKIWRYDLECEGIGKQGSKLVKVWSYSKNPKHAISRAMKNAVHGIIFKGYAGGGTGCTPSKALVGSATKVEEHASFFDAFFLDGGEYLKYVSAATDGNIGPGDRLKVSRREYKIGVVVNVLHGQLRKRLEEEGILRGLSSGF